MRAFYVIGVRRCVWLASRCFAIRESIHLPLTTTNALQAKIKQIRSGEIMYEVFRANTLRYLGDLDKDTLEKIANAMDMSYREVPFDSQESDDKQSDAYEFASVIDSYVTARKMEGLSDGTTMHMERILKSFMNKTSKPIRNIKTYDIRGYISSYQSERNISNRSLDFIRTIICTFFKWCATEGYLDSNPAANVRPVKYIRKPRKALSQLELEIVRRACKTERETCIVEVLYSTGCRVSELCNIKLSDINWANREITVLGKGSKYRSVYLNAKAEIAIKVYLSHRKHTSEWLLCNDRGGGKMSKDNVEKIFRRIESETGITVSPHIMRHTFATQAITGAGVEIVQQMLGHANISTTMIYAEIDMNEVKAAHVRSVV